MSWTTSQDLISQVERLWSQGLLLSASPRLNENAGEGLQFPLQLRLRRPAPRDLGERFGDVQTWIKDLDAGSTTTKRFGYSIDWEEIQSRELGRNRLPAAVTVPTREDALELIGKSEAACVFDALVADTLAEFPDLRPWLRKRALTALENARDWSVVLACLDWFRKNPRPGVYLREIDLPGAGTKFIEVRKPLLTELLDIVLPSEAIEAGQTGAKGFELRYGLKTKPATVRFRILDETLAISGLTDLTVPIEQFATLVLGAERVYIVENEITGLSFPAADRSIVILGLGYAVKLLSAVRWLRDVKLIYWGDIDTHGFVMLDRLRAVFPHARSLLMNLDTLHAHRHLWTEEDAPFDGPLDHLTPEECACYDGLRFGSFGRAIRLEQERISLALLIDQL